MRDQDDDAPISVYVLKHLHDLISGIRVRISSGLVRENDRRAFTSALVIATRGHCPPEWFCRLVVVDG